MNAHNKRQLISIADLPVLQVVRGKPPVQSLATVLDVARETLAVPPRASLHNLEQLLPTLVQYGCGRLELNEADFIVDEDSCRTLDMVLRDFARKQCLSFVEHSYGYSVSKGERELVFVIAAKVIAGPDILKGHR